VYVEHNYTILNANWQALPANYGAGRMVARWAGYMCQSAQPPAPSFFQTTLTRLTFTGPDGTEMELVDQKTGGQPEPGAYNTPGFDRGRVFISEDGSSAIFTASSDISDVSGNCSAAGASWV
jgi:hypothetical protein